MSKSEANTIVKAIDREQRAEEKGESFDARQKPPFRLAKDDTKPFLRDPILRSDPIETEEAVLRLPPFPFSK